MKVYWSYKSIPDLKGLSTEEAKLRHKRAHLEARMLVEDKLKVIAFYIQALPSAVGAVLGGTHGAIGSAIWAAMGAAVGGVIASAYERLTLNAKAAEVLRHVALQGVQADRP